MKTHRKKNNSIQYVCNNSKQFSITIGVKEEKKRENWTRKNI
jgi:hypothetical protein